MRHAQPADEHAQPDGNGRQRLAPGLLWGEAVGRGLGWGPGTFLSIYTDNRKDAAITDLLDSPLGNVLLELAHRMPAALVSGSVASVHAKLTEIAGKQIAASADWPKSTTKFGIELRRLAPQLRLHGLSVVFERRHDGRMITLKSEPATTATPVTH